MSLKPIDINEVSEELETESILELVSLGKFDLTIADSHIALMASKVYKSLRVHNKVTLRDNAKISWAVPKKSNLLLNKINEFIPKVKKGTLLGNVNLKKYYENFSRIRANSKNKQQISPYDIQLKKYANKYKWDWMILASLAYQESRFKQNIENKWGAVGLFQIKRMVASEPYINIKPIDGNKNVNNNIHAGVKYLSWLRKTYFNINEKINLKNQIRFSLAAYNAGPGRIKKARKRAKAMKLNPNVWFRNVEYALLAGGHYEPVKYVSEINSRYLAYSLLSNKK